jgi:hypothetical protein
VAAQVVNLQTAGEPAALVVHQMVVRAATHLVMVEHNLLVERLLHGHLPEHLVLVPLDIQMLVHMAPVAQPVVVEVVTTEEVLRFTPVVVDHLGTAVAM